MKRSRKWLTLVIAWIMLISLAGCAGRASEEAKQEETNLLTETAADLQVVFAKAVREYIESGADQSGKGFDPRKLLKGGRDAIVERTKELICQFGSDGKGWA